MIKRYILHIEAHKWHLPRVSFKRAPQHGDRVVDGGVPGTLVRCPTCQDGFLHKPDSTPRVKRSRARTARPTTLERLLADLATNLTERTVYPARPTRSDHASRRAMDFNPPTHVEIKATEPKVEVKPEPKPEPKIEVKPEPKPERPSLNLTIPEPDKHVELKVAEHVEVKVGEEKPEELELDYDLGTNKYKLGETVWTHHAEYVVDKQTKKKLYLVRKDIWEERQKKAEHVELEVKDPGTSEVVLLNFSKPTD